MTETQAAPETPPEVQTVHTPETHQGLWDAAKTKMREYLQNIHIANGVRELGMALHSLDYSFHSRFSDLEDRLKAQEQKLADTIRKLEGKAPATATPAVSPNKLPVADTADKTADTAKPTA